MKGIVKIVGTWELGWNTPIKEIELWEYPLRDYGVDQFHMCPVSGIKSDFVTEHADIAKFLESERLQGRSIVFVDELGSTELSKFIHPENVTYVFGKATQSLMKTFSKKNDQSVKIITKNNLGLLWPHQAATIILHDRIMK